MHLDLRSSNIYLSEENSEDGFPKPKISNFLYSVYKMNSCTNVRPCLSSSIDNQVRRRWLDLQRLKDENEHSFESDYYSLGMLLWEIFNATGALPYKTIKIKDLYKHLKNNSNRETFPEDLPSAEYKTLINKIKKAWDNNPEERTSVESMIMKLREFVKKKRTASTSTNASDTV